MFGGSDRAAAGWDQGWAGRQPVPRARAGPQPPRRSEWGQPRQVQRSGHAGFPRLSTPGLTTGQNFLPSPFSWPTALAQGWVLEMGSRSLPCSQEAPRHSQSQGGVGRGRQNCPLRAPVYGLGAGLLSLNCALTSPGGVLGRARSSQGCPFASVFCSHRPHRRRELTKKTRLKRCLKRVAF